MSTTTTAPQVHVSRVFNAPRELVFQAFTDPDQFSAWWGPIGNSLPREGIEMDVRPGGHIQWKEVFPEMPDAWTIGRFDLTDAIDGELLEGTMRIDGKLPHGFQPFETQMRLEFHDESDGRTRIEVRQWLSENLISPTENGWRESFSKLDAVLAAH